MCGTQPTLSLDAKGNWVALCGNKKCHGYAAGHGVHIREAIAMWNEKQAVKEY
jgi:hypothetical protein